MSLQAEKQAAAALDDANWRIEARETAARIANDMQEIMAAAEAVFMRWAEDGLLDRTRYDWERVNGQMERVLKERRSALEASAHHAACIKDVLYDALSVSAREAVEAKQ